MTAKNQNFEMFCGDTHELPVTVRDSSGALKDITGAAVAWALAKSVKCDPEFTKATGSGIALTDPSNGLFTVTLNPADTLNLCPGDYYHEAEVTDSSGRVVTVMTGRVRLLPSIA